MKVIATFKTACGCRKTEVLSIDENHWRAGMMFYQRFYPKLRCETARQGDSPRAMTRAFKVDWYSVSTYDGETFRAEFNEVFDA